MRMRSSRDVDSRLLASSRGKRVNSSLRIRLLSSSTRCEGSFIDQLLVVPDPSRVLSHFPRNPHRGTRSAIGLLVSHKEVTLTQARCLTSQGDTTNRWRFGGR